MRFPSLARSLALGLSLLTASCGGDGAQPQVAGKPAPNDIVTEEFNISSEQDGVRLYIRNKHFAEYYTPSPARTVLFVHGASFAGSATFDAQVGGVSWMDWLAKRGYDVYSIDLRGYGRSGRPAEMRQPAENAGPIVTGAQAAEDVSAAVDFILSRRNIERLVLIGWSWGATVAGDYTVQSRNIRVERLVLYAPQWLKDGPSADLKLGAWRNVPLTAIRDHWLDSLPEKRRDDFAPRASVDAWINALKAADPDAARQDPPALRVPNGAVADSLATWAAGKPAWTPAHVTVPTLVVQAEWDSESSPQMGLALFSELTGSHYRRYALIGEGSHMIMLEKNRQQLFSVIQQFLEEKR